VSPPRDLPHSPIRRPITLLGPRLLGHEFVRPETLENREARADREGLEPKGKPLPRRKSLSTYSPFGVVVGCSGGAMRQERDKKMGDTTLQR